MIQLGSDPFCTIFKNQPRSQMQAGLIVIGMVFREVLFLSEYCGFTIVLLLEEQFVAIHIDHNLFRVLILF